MELNVILELQNNLNKITEKLIAILGYDRNSVSHSFGSSIAGYHDFFSTHFFWNEDTTKIILNDPLYRIYLNEWNLSGGLLNWADSLKNGRDEQTEILNVIRDSLFKKQGILNKIKKEIKDGHLNRERSLVFDNDRKQFLWGKKKKRTITLNPQSLPYKILYFLYQEYLSRGEIVVTYEEIEEYLVSKGERSLESKSEISKRIRAALGNNDLLRFGKIGTEPLKMIDGFKEIIKQEEGKGYHIQDIE